jgi:ribosomal protein S18 acetylase RimI-like enzyme
MVDTLISIRTARSGDETSIAQVHDAAWRDAYRGIIPGRELEQMIARRGPVWWRHAIAQGSRMLVLDFGDKITGYSSYGRNRVAALKHDYRGEIYELYLAPEYQGVGFGRRMFEAAQKDMADHGYRSFLVWALADNERAYGFYSRLGGAVVRRAPEKFGDETRERVAFGFE